MDDAAAPPARDWSRLPLDVLSSIFIRLGAVDVLTGAGLVCRLWLEAAMLPDRFASPSLRTLRLVSYNDVFSQQVASAIKESPLLELRSLELGEIDITVGELTAILEDCPALEVLRLHNCLDIDDTHTLQAKFPRIKNLTLEWDDEYWSRFYTDGSYSDSAPDSEDERTDGSM